MTADVADDLLAACLAMREEIRERLAQEGLEMSNTPKSHYSDAFNAMLAAINKAQEQTRES